MSQKDYDDGRWGTQNSAPNWTGEHQDYLNGQGDRKRARERQQESSEALGRNLGSIFQPRTNQNLTSARDSEPLIKSAPSETTLRKRSLVGAMLGAIVFGMLAANGSISVTPIGAIILGAIAGALVPPVLAVIFAMAAFLGRAALVLLKIAACIALIGFVLYIVAGALQR